MEQTVLGPLQPGQISGQVRAPTDSLPTTLRMFGSPAGRETAQANRLLDQLAAQRAGTSAPLSVRAARLLNAIDGELGGPGEAARILRRGAVDQGQLNADADMLGASLFDIFREIVMGAMEDRDQAAANALRSTVNQMASAEGGELVVGGGGSDAHVLDPLIRPILEALLNEGQRGSDAGKVAETPLERILERLEERPDLLDQVEDKTITSDELVEAVNTDGRGVATRTIAVPESMVSIRVPGLPGFEVPFAEAAEIRRAIAALRARLGEDELQRARQQIEQLQQEQDPTSTSEERCGPCDCPNDRDAAGKRCGNRSAYVKAGGCSPSCSRDPFGRFQGAPRKLLNELNSAS